MGELSYWKYIIEILGSSIFSYKDAIYYNVKL